MIKTVNSNYIKVSPSKMRSPEKVMRLSRMGSSFQTRLSFIRSLTRRITREKWKFDKIRFDLDKDGYGVSVFAVKTPERTYSLVTFTNAISPEKRTDRVVAEEWDATFNLFDGIPTKSDIKRLSLNTPKQEAGRFSPSELVLGRANKSIRLFEHVVSRLSEGKQPDLEILADVGYLMRTTAVYGSGKFGCADREKISSRPETKGAFQVELLTVYLFRWFALELVEHVAKQLGGGKSVSLNPEISKFLGVGNATGLGMAPFLFKHPILIHKWVLARETALSRVLAIESYSKETFSLFSKYLLRAIQHITEWSVEDKIQTNRILKTRNDLKLLSDWLAIEQNLEKPFLWERILLFAERNFSLEGQELTVSLLLEPHGELIDDLEDDMQTSEFTVFDPSMNLTQLKKLLQKSFSWALEIDFEDPEKQRRFWYYSEEKLEPRFGDRYAEPGSEQEMQLAVARDVYLLSKKIKKVKPYTSVGKFLILYPEFRHIVRRVQTVVHFPYAEIQDNVLDAEMRPVDLLRFKLAFFGASKFDPKSELWTRITLFQGAPLPHELKTKEKDEWAFPVMPA